MNSKLNQILNYFSIYNKIENSNEMKIDLLYNFIIKDQMIFKFWDSNLKTLKKKYDIIFHKIDLKFKKFNKLFKTFKLKIKNLKMKIKKTNNAKIIITNKYNSLSFKNNLLEKKYSNLIKNNLKNENNNKEDMDLENVDNNNDNKENDKIIINFDSQKKRRVNKINPLNKYKYWSTILKLFNSNLLNLKNKIFYENYITLIYSSIDDLVKINKEKFGEKLQYIYFISNSLEFILKLILNKNHLIYFKSFQNEVNPINIFPIKFSIKNIQINKDFNIMKEPNYFLLTCYDSLLLLNKELLLINDESKEILNSNKTKNLENLEKNDENKKFLVKDIHKKIKKDYEVLFNNIKIYLLSNFLLNIMFNLKDENIANNINKIKNFDWNDFLLNSLKESYIKWLNSLIN